MASEDRGLYSLISKQTMNNRGEVDIRLIFGVFVLFLVAPPLVAAGAELQDGLSSTPAFSELAAAVIAGLIILALVVKILGIE